MKGNIKNKENFWKKLKRPIFVLAPMADVTDMAFREIISKYGKPDVFWTEFVSADGLFMGGKKALIENLKFSKKQKPIVAQFFTSKPEMMEKASRLAVKMGFDGIDINMGCPDRSVEKQGAGAALMKSPALAREIIQSAKAGAGKVPVSVKTRVGYNKDELDTWLPEILAEEPAVVTIHARTRKQLSEVPADWNFIKRAVQIRDRMKVETLIFGNGDVKDLNEAKKLAKETGADGVMIGRGIFGNPWLFSGKVPTIKEKLKVLLEHTKLFERFFNKPKSAGGKNFSVMKKHFKAYVLGFDGAKELRTKLMETNSYIEVKKVVDGWLKNNKEK